MARLFDFDKCFPLIDLASSFNVSDVFSDSFLRETKSPLPYNYYIDKDSNQHILQYAVAGYSKDEISIEIEDNNILVILIGKEKSNKTEKPDKLQYYHRGISKKSIICKWKISDPKLDLSNIKAECIDGLLTITIPLITPKEPKKIKIF